MRLGHKTDITLSSRAHVQIKEESVWRIHRGEWAFPFRRSTQQNNRKYGKYLAMLLSYKLWLYTKQIISNHLQHAIT